MVLFGQLHGLGLEQACGSLTQLGVAEPDVPQKQVLEGPVTWPRDNDPGGWTRGW